MKILLIEADKLLADNLLAALKSNGHQVIWQVDLQEALGAMDSERLEAIILDLVLAGRSGIEFLYELRSYPEWQNIPVYVWSDMPDSEAQQLIGGAEDLEVTAYHHKSHSRLKDIIASLSPASTAV